MPDQKEIELLIRAEARRIARLLIINGKSAPGLTEEQRKIYREEVLDSYGEIHIITPEDFVKQLISFNATFAGKHLQGKDNIVLDVVGSLVINAIVIGGYQKEVLGLYLLTLLNPA